MNFQEKLNSATDKNNSLLCIGLDPDPELMPAKIDSLNSIRQLLMPPLTWYAPISSTSPFMKPLTMVLTP